MNKNSKLIALLTAALVTSAPLSANAASFSDNVFSWPTDYKSQKASEAKSTLDDNIKNFEIKKPAKNKTQTQKRK